MAITTAGDFSRSSMQFPSKCVQPEWRVVKSEVTAMIVQHRYGIQVLVLDGFDRFTGKIHTLAAALADPKQTEWKLVQADNRSIVFMRQPPPGVQPLNSLQALQSIESQCQQQIEHDPKQPACARGIADFYTLIGERARAAQWMAYYESRQH